MIFFKIPMLMIMTINIILFVLSIILLLLSMALREQSQSIDLKHNQLIWGKLPGLPWWPGQIACPQNQQQKLYRVDFFGYPSNQIRLPSSKIIKYQEFDKSLNASRMSPALKRAVSQASCLFHAIQQSKSSLPNNLDPNTQNTVLSIGSPQEKSWLIQNSLNETELSNRKTRLNEDEFIKETDINQGEIKKRKPRKMKKIKQNRNQGSLIDLESVQKLLKEYRLDRIPLPLQEMLQIQQYSSTVKKLYKIFRRSHPHSAKLCKQMALKVTQQIIRSGEWKSLLKEYKESLTDQTILEQFLRKYIKIQ